MYLIQVKKNLKLYDLTLTLEHFRYVLGNLYYLLYRIRNTVVY